MDFFYMVKPFAIFIHHIVDIAKCQIHRKSKWLYVENKLQVTAVNIREIENFKIGQWQRKWFSGAYTTLANISDGAALRK